MKVRVYMKRTNSRYEFPARNVNHAREIAGRIVTEGLWTEGDTEEFYPINEIYKVKIIK